MNRRWSIPLGVALATIVGAVSGFGCSGRDPAPDHPATRAWLLALGSSEASVLRSDDGGATWSVAVSFEGTGFSDLVFVDAANGWLVGTDALLRTADGGSSWVDQRSRLGLAPGVVPRLSAVAASAGGFAVAVGDESPMPPPLITGRPIILRTADGGRSWLRAEIEPPIDRLAVRAVCLTRAGYGIAVGTSTIGGVMVLRSVDAGARWDDITRAGVRNGDLACAGDEILWLTGRDATGSPGFSRSTDGGDTWVDASDGARELLDEIFSVTFVDAEHGWVTGAASGVLTILRTDDGGTTWIRHDFPTDSFEHVVAFADPHVGIGVGSRGRTQQAVFHTQDGGATWLEGRLPEIAVERIVSASVVSSG